MLSRRSVILGASAAFILPRRVLLAAPLAPVGRSALAYPSEAPGVNWSHPASALLRQSGYSTGASFQDIYTLSSLGAGAANTLTGSVSALMSVVGPMTVFAGATTYTQKFGYPTAAPQAETAAGIILPTSFPSTVSPFTGTSIFRFTSGGVLQVGVSGIGSTNTVTITANIPWFVAASFNANTLNAVSTNLLTGAVSTFTGAGYVPGVFINYFGLGKDGGGSYWNGGVSRTMASGAYLRLKQLVSWALVPWAFWHPPTVNQQIFSGLRSFGGNLPQRTLMGVGL